MDCLNCNHQLPKVGFFCSNCGSKIEKLDHIKPHTQKIKPQINKSKLYSESVAALSALRIEIAKTANQKNKKRKVLAAFFFGVFLLVAIVARAEFSVVFLVVATLFVISRRNPNRWLFREEYYSLPGSRLSDEGHRCIKCGSTGIYKKGQYKTNNTYSRCSRCEQPFFVN